MRIQIDLGDGRKPIIEMDHEPSPEELDGIGDELKRTYKPKRNLPPAPDRQPQYVDIPRKGLPGSGVPRQPTVVDQLLNPKHPQQPRLKSFDEQLGLSPKGPYNPYKKASPFDTPPAKANTPSIALKKRLPERVEDLKPIPGVSMQAFLKAMRDSDQIVEMQKGQLYQGRNYMPLHEAIRYFIKSNPQYDLTPDIVQRMFPSRFKSEFDRTDTLNREAEEQIDREIQAKGRKGFDLKHTVEEHILGGAARAIGGTVMGLVDAQAQISGGEPLFKKYTLEQRRQMATDLGHGSIGGFDVLVPRTVEDAAINAVGAVVAGPILRAAYKYGIKPIAALIEAGVKSRGIAGQAINLGMSKAEAEAFEQIVKPLGRKKAGALLDALAETKGGKNAMDRLSLEPSAAAAERAPSKFAAELPLYEKPELPVLTADPDAPTPEIAQPKTRARKAKPPVEEPLPQVRTVNPVDPDAPTLEVATPKRSIADVDAEIAEIQARRQARSAGMGSKRRGAVAKISQEDWEDAFKLGSLYIERGVRTFADWSSQMIRNVGPWVKPHLTKIYQQVSRGEGATPLKRAELNLMPDVRDVPGRYTVPDAESNLWQHLTTSGGVPKNPRLHFEDEAGRVYFGSANESGKAFDDWIDEVNSTMTPDEIKASRLWYGELKTHFQNLYGDDADKMMTAWLASQQNVSPSGGLANVLTVVDRLAGYPAKQGGLADEKIAAILSDSTPDKGLGKKLLDFADAGMGKRTRSVMGNDPRGGGPFVADVHTGRDSGHVDHTILTWLQERFGKGGKLNGKPITKISVLETKTLKMGAKTQTVPEKVRFHVKGGKYVDVSVDMVGSPQRQQYEGISRWGNALTEELNARGFDGGGWTPDQAQAVGWMRMLRSMGRPGESVETAIAKNTHRIGAEVNYSTGGSLKEVFPEFGKLPLDIQSDITEGALVPTVKEMVDSIGGSLKYLGGKLGLGYWEGEAAPSMSFWVMGTDAAADRLTNMLAAVTDQSGTFRMVFGKGGKNKLAAIIQDANGKALPEDVVRDFLAYVAKQKDAPFQGLSAHVGPNEDGHIIAGLTQAKYNKVEELLERFLDERGIDAQITSTSAEVKFGGNDWEANRYGEAYKERLQDSGGTRLAEQVDDHRRSFVARLDGLLREHGLVDEAGRADRIRRATEGFGREVTPRRTLNDVRADIHDVKARMDERATGMGSKRRGAVSKITREDLVDALELGKLYFEAGTRGFVEWSERMIKDVGEAIRPHLPRLYKETHPGISKLTELVKKAEPIRDEYEIMKAAERQQRAARLAGAQEGARGEAGFNAALETQRGEFAKPTFEAPRSSLTQEEVDELFDLSNHHPDLRPWEKVRSGTALKKLLTGQIPTEGDLAMLERVYGKDLAKAVLSKRSGWAKLKDNILQLPGLMRTLATTLDMSATLNQGGILARSHTKEWAGALRVELKAFASAPEYAEEVERLIFSSPKQALREKAGLYLSRDTIAGPLDEMEEAFANRITGQAVYVGGKDVNVLARSERSYRTFLNKLRADVFDNMVDAAVKKNGGKDLTDRQLKWIAEYINVATGRGPLPPFLQKSGSALGHLLFAPRYLAAKVQYPITIAKGLTIPGMRVQAAKEVIAMAGTTVIMLKLAEAAGAKVEWDWRSSDFAKIRIGNTRLDITSGFATFYRYVGQFITSEVKTADGEIKESNRKDIALDRFGRSKLAPIPSIIWDVTEGKTFIGEKPTVMNETVERVIPLGWKDFAEAVKEHGWAEGSAIGALGLFGVSGNTYGQAGRKDENKKPSLPKMPKMPSLPAVGK